MTHWLMRGTGVTAFVLCASLLQAEIQTKELDYRQGETTLQGYLAYDDAVKGKRPGVLVVHEWWGHNEHARKQARRLAEAGYVGFALDMYGKGKLAKHPKEAGEFAGAVGKDAALARARFEAALKRLRGQKQVDPEQVHGNLKDATVEIRSGDELIAQVDGVDKIEWTDKSGI